MMPRFLTPFTICLMLASSLAVPAMAEERTITVQGTGSASAAPDILTVSIGVEASGKEAAATMRVANARASNVIEAAKTLGVAPRDMQTGGVSLSPIYARNEPRNNNQPQEPKLIGYRVNNTVTIRLRDLDTAGESVGTLVEAGANRLNGLSFGFDDATALMDEARRDAVADARRKAELYATAAGVTLGPIMTIEESGGGGGPRMMATARSFDAAESAVPLERGENTVTTNVRIVWEIAE